MDHTPSDLRVMEDGEMLSNNTERQPENPLCRRARKICSSVISEELLINLEAIGSIHAVKNATLRRNLQSDLEQRVLNEHQTFVADLKNLTQGLQEGHTAMNAVNQEISQKMDHIRSVKTGSRIFIEEVSELDRKLKVTDQQLLLARSIRSSLTLSPREVEILTQGSPSDRAISRDFFDALTRVETICAHCKTLMRLHAGSQVLGMQLLDLASKSLNAGYQKLYRYSLEECRKLTMENPVIAPILRESIKALQTQGSMLPSVLAEYAAARKSIVTSLFLAALTKGTAASSRPLELHSYDSLRYITLVLGWIHQSVATEKDYLAALLKDLKVVDGQQIAADVFTIITEGLIQPLQSRLEHLITTEQNVVILYKIQHWTRFYVEKIRITISESDFENPFLQLLRESTAGLQNQYLFALRSLASNLGKKLDVPHEDLQPSFSLTSVLSLLRDLIACHEFQHGNAEDITILISVVLEPLLKMCNESASHVQPNTPTATAVYLLNCFYVIKCALFPTSGQYGSLGDLLDRQCDAHVDTLVSETSGSIMSTVRMRPLLDVLRFSEQSRTAPDDYDVEQFLAAFNAYLANPEEFLPKEIHLLQSSLVRSNVIRTAQQLVSDYYKQINPLLLTSKFAALASPVDVVQRFLVR